MCWLQTVAVWTEDPKVVESVVVFIAVDVIELQRNTSIRRALCPAAQLALALLEAGREESQFETVTAGWSSSNENQLEWNRGRREPLPRIPALCLEM